MTTPFDDLRSKTGKLPKFSLVGLTPFEAQVVDSLEVLRAGQSEIKAVLRSNLKDTELNTKDIAKIHDWQRIEEVRQGKDTAVKVAAEDAVRVYQSKEIRIANVAWAAIKWISLGGGITLINAFINHPKP